jgi:hypothetical protein
VHSAGRAHHIPGNASSSWRQDRPDCTKDDSGQP